MISGNKEKKKIGLALGSGAARGLAHIGVLKALKEKDVPVEVIAGSSMGALVGACYARWGEIGSLEEIVLKTDWKQLARLADPNVALLFKGVIYGKKVKELLKTLIGDVEFKDLLMPLAVVATDVNTGEEVIIREGSVIEAVGASIAIPGIFMAVKFKNRFLMDGGIVNPLPVKIVKDMGANFVIACNVINKYQRKKPPAPAPKKKPSSVSLPGSVTMEALNDKINKLIQENKDRVENFQRLIDAFTAKFLKGTPRIDPDTPNIFDAILQALYTMEYEIASLKEKEANIIISPKTGCIDVLEFYRGKEAILEGYKAAKGIFSKDNASFFI